MDLPKSRKMMRTGGPMANAMTEEGEAALTQNPMANAQKVFSTIVTVNTTNLVKMGFRPTLQYIIEQ
jgi:hypothetical protein